MKRTKNEEGCNDFKNTVIGHRIIPIELTLISLKPSLALKMF